MVWLNQCQSWLLSDNGLMLISCLAIFLLLLRVYCSGAVCRVSRDLSGKVIVVTGANSGIGKQTMRQLSKYPCTIYFGARDTRKSQETVKQLQRQKIKAKIVFYPLDLTDTLSIKQFSQKIISQVNQIDILINNAGVMAISERKQTANGFQTQIGTNHFGHFYLTYLLWEKIKKAKGFRVINISSNAHRGIGISNFFNPSLKIDFQDIHFKKGYDSVEAYGRSKAANILFTKQLQRKIDESGLDGFTVSLRPGSVRTQITRYVSWKVSLFQFIMHPLLFIVMKSPWEGAQTTLYLALEEEAKIKKGGYYSDCKLMASSEFVNNPQNALRLWKVSEQQLKIRFVI